MQSKSGSEKRPNPQKHKWPVSGVWSFRPDDDVRALTIEAIGEDGDFSRFINESIRTANPEALLKAIIAKFQAQERDLAVRWGSAKRSAKQWKADANKILAEMQCDQATANDI